MGGDGGLDDEALLERVTAAFEPYLTNHHSQTNVRQLLRGYIGAQIKTGSSNDGPAGEGVLKGARAEYIDAVRSNRAAKERFDSALLRLDPEGARTDANKTEESTIAGSTSTSVIDQHVELLQLQNQHAALVTLRDKLDDIKHARASARLEAPSRAAATMSSQTYKRELLDLKHIRTGRVDSLQQAIRTLERAVVEAHRRATLERNLLEKVKADSHDLSNASHPDGTTTSRRRLHSLAATKSELTAWLEENLEICQSLTAEEIHANDNGHEHEVSEINLEEWERQVEDEYERYLAARKRLLLALGSLKRPLPDQPNADAHTTNNAGQIMLQDPPTVRQPAKMGISNIVEQRLLPVLQQQNATQTYLAFAREQHEEELRQTINMLERLGDESQILLAYPLLARSGRFEHAKSIFRKRMSPADEAEQDEITRRIEPWLFAADAADTASSSTIETQLKESKESMEHVSGSLAELGLLHEVNG
ncbi:hypothetical protein ABEF95_013513 [Exophiala dermatitidis]|uniref:Uncharacterized protein n=1 Tax=Exophiala dermatitidis (strain ATCC 34100 / CBS 525.76 / NIH/UT8656) TaxID=858893 RepID=H6CAR1_EXODN|nr:uncharacterized protein HMPREF1120_08802 [Exophiala dermatitidis NIH/UT8656]EHY60858.1 hypothetical protein HMPREF1120_08802 [Exophiala dermatitidis NIH/UT8656]